MQRVATVPALSRWRYEEVSNVRVLIMGAGSMGSVAGGFLAMGGHPVTLVGRPAHMRAIEEAGLRITGIWGEHVVRNLTTRTDVGGLRTGDFDLILVTVKSYDTAGTALLIAPLVDEQTLVCSYQNGLGNAETLAAVVGWEHVIGVRAIFGAVVMAPGIVKVTVIANPTAIGRYHDATPAARVREIADAMANAGLPTVFTDRVASLLWGKVAYNCALNPLSALLDVPYGVLTETEHTRVIMRDVVTELYAVAAAMGIVLEPDSAQAYVDVLFNQLVPPTAAHYASMHADFQLERRTEIDALNGAICRYGEQHGVPCPANEMLTRLVRAREYAMGVRY